MAKKPMDREGQAMSHLNAMIPADLHRRLLIAKANTGKKIGQLVTEWLEAGLAQLEQKPADKPSQRPRS
jgi:hypothetical protein